MHFARENVSITCNFDMILRSFENFLDLLSMMYEGHSESNVIQNEASSKMCTPIFSRFNLQYEHAHFGY